MRNLSFILLLFITSILYAQTAPSIQWQKSMGGSNVDLFHFVEPTSDGGYIVSGSTFSNNGDLTQNFGSRDAWIIKFDFNGNIQWQKLLGGSQAELFHSIRETSDGGYILAGGSTSADGNLTSNNGFEDYWIVKLDSTGDIEWQKSMGGSDRDIAKDILQTSDEGYIIAGTSYSNDGDVLGNHGGADIWIIKTNSAGNVQWQKSLGSSSVEQVQSIQQTSDNGYIIGAATGNIADGDVTQIYGGSDYWIIKLDSYGNLQWQKSLGGTGFDTANSIQQTFDGGYIVAGIYERSIYPYPLNSDYGIIKLASNGDVQWQKFFGGNKSDGAKSIQQTADGGYIIAGLSNSNNGDVLGNHGNTDAWIIKTDNTGTLQWQKSLGGTGNENAETIRKTVDGGFIIIGYSSSINGDVSENHGNIDGWIVKLSPEQLSISESQKMNPPNLYPNPAKDFFYADNLPQESNIDITDMSGRKIFSQKNHEKKIKINTSAFSEGIYIVQIKSKEEIILSKKITVSR
ncbi:T9SS type A sorting domain-containing protein [Chryseobacterium sp. ES2]|uniref:T9SS type A sorting domain-containing protein n=1 Tax=Chryseobacterium metallicongregator TaxID=3073042 RepID=A0ABU1E105_9FLAO|nr:T9SS type A sorting domain-containing protein [Chryseobacterium sp. ES2]MDR4951478.1 T9SS type A sorting domain-containing protein [Chryseobacterium sp. ES2]